MQPAPIRVILRTKNEEHICKYLPAGWRDQSASWILDYKTFGFNLKYSTEKLRFVKEDADFLRRQIDLYGISAEIDFTVQYRQENWTYADSFTGQINLPAGYINDRDFVEVAVVEGGLKRAYSQNQKTNYEIPLSDADAVDIEVPEGMQLFEDINYGNFFDLATGYGGHMNEAAANGELYQKKEIVYTAIGENSSLQSKGFSAHTQEGEPYSVSTDKNGFLEVRSEKNVYLSFNLHIRLKIERVSGLHTGNMRFLIVIYRNGNEEGYVDIGTISSDDLGGQSYQGTPATPPTVIRDYDREFSYQFLSGWDNEPNYYKFRLMLWYNALGYQIPVNTIRTVAAMNVNFFGTENTGVFSFKAISAEKVADKLLKEIHAPAVCQIPFLQAMEQQGMQLFLTSGDGIRGLPEAQIKTNFEEFQDNLSCLFDTGTQVNNLENSYKITDKQAVLNPNNLLLDLGTVKNMQLKSIPDEWLANNILVGYEKQEYDYPLGRQDFACTLEYINDLKIPNKKMELVSKYRADYTGVHLLHYEYVNSDKTDSKSDNDIFWILAFLKDGKWQAIKGDAVTIGTDSMEGGGYFNILLSPHRNLRRHKNYLKSILDKHGEDLRYTTSTETQTNIVSTYGGETIKEKDDESVLSGTVLFKPVVFEFDALIKKNLAQAMGETPAGYVTFNFNGITCKGFPIEITGSITDSSQKVTCVAHPDTPDDIQRLLFKKQGMSKNNEISIVVTEIGGALADGYDVRVQLSAQFPVSSDVAVLVRSEASWDNGVTWEEDTVTGFVALNLTIPYGQTISNSEDIPNPAGYTNRRFTIVSITPEKDVDFRYVAGEQVVV